MFSHRCSSCSLHWRTKKRSDTDKKATLFGVAFLSIKFADYSTNLIFDISLGFASGDSSG